MARFEWKSDYSVGDAVLDGQHRKMLAILNALADALAAPTQDAGASRAIFDQVAAYVTEHFAYEEQLIADAGYPEERVAAHRLEHNRILRQLQHFESVFESGDTRALEEMMPFVYGEWLIHHICETDRDYMPFIAER